MSKHHQYHPSQTGNLQATKKSQLVDSNHHGTSNGFRTNSSINNQPMMNNFEHATQSNDTNNNYNKHRGHKRSSAEPNSNANSSKKSKLSVPSDKSGKSEGDEEKSSQNHYNIMEKLKELYKELKNDKSCKEVSKHHIKFNKKRRRRKKNMVK